MVYLRYFQIISQIKLWPLVRVEIEHAGWYFNTTMVIFILIFVPYADDT